MNKKHIIYNLLSIIIVLSIIISNLNIATANKKLNVTQSITTLYLEDNKLPISVYKIKNEDYVPLAAIINFFSMKANFDKNNNLVIITQDETIDTKKEFYNFIDDGEHIVHNSKHTMDFYGNKFSVPNLKLVDNYNFIPISELDDFFGYKLLYNKTTNSVVMTQDYFYSLNNQTFSNYSQYIKDNKIDFDFTNMESLKTIDFENYSIYLLGENHAISKNTDIKLSFIKFLYENYGVRYIIDESGYCDTIMFNLFLQTGDTSIIEENIKSVKGTYSYTKENYEFYTKLYEFNKTLPEDKKIIIVGIDVQHNWKKGLDIIKLFIEENKETSDTIKDVINIINKDELEPNDIKSALDIISANELEFKQYFDNRYLDFYFGLRSIWQSMEFYTEHDFSAREEFIHENIRDLYTLFDMKKCFGMFGGSHTILNGTMDKNKNLAQYLNTEFEATNNKVLSIMCMYQNCYYMNRSTGNSTLVTPNFSKILNKTLAEFITGNYGICPTEEIPFEDGKLSDMFQYMLSVKNSPASTSFGSYDVQ